jgi:hypothetical protein
MKTYKIFGFIAAIVLTFASCETQVDDPAGPRGTAVVPSVTNLNPAVYDSNELETTYVQFTLGLDAPATEAIVVVSINGDKSRATVGTYTSFPATVKVLLSDVVIKLGMTLEDVELGDIFNFEIGAVIGGKTYYSNAAFNAPVVCAYNPELVTGSYRAVSAGWEVDGNVTITVDPEDDYIVYVAGLVLLDGAVEDQGPLKMIINPLNFQVTAVKTVLGSSFYGYTNVAYAGSGLLNTCTGTYNMLFSITVDQGSFGSYDFVLTKN